MALVLAAVLALPIVEIAMPARKSPVTTDPAALALLQTLHPHATGIDVGAAEMMVCVPAGSGAGAAVAGALPANVRCFGTFTPDLQAIASWLEQCGVATVALESTGVYWIALYDLLESKGFQVVREAGDDGLSLCFSNSARMNQSMRWRGQSR